jgi:hypothetical protein
VAARRLLIEKRDFEVKAEVRRIKLRKAACQREFPLHYILMKARVRRLASSETVLGQVLRLPARFCGIEFMRTPIRGCEAWIHIHVWIHSTQAEPIYGLDIESMMQLGEAGAVGCAEEL